MKNNIISQLPVIKMGEKLKKALAVLPEYDADIKNADITERLLALSNIYDVYIPSDMSVEIYSKSNMKKCNKVTIKNSYHDIKK